MNIWENSYALPSHQNHPGKPNTQSLQWHADEHPTDPLVSSNMVCPKAGQKIDFLSCKFWHCLCQAGTNLWSTAASHEKQRISEGGKESTSTPQVGQPRTLWARHPPVRPLMPQTLPHLELWTPGAGPLSAIPSILFHLASLQSERITQRYISTWMVVFWQSLQPFGYNFPGFH